jgi:hypothetical protein
VEGTRVAYSMDVGHCSTAATQKTNKGRFPDPIDNLESLVPKISDKIIMLQLLFNLMTMWHNSQFLIKTTQHMKNVFFVHRRKRVINS